MNSISMPSKEDSKFNRKVENNDSRMASINDDLQLWTLKFERLFHSYKRYNELRRKDDAIKERFNDLQTKLQELDVFRQSPNEFYRTTTPSSRDSGVPIRSSSSCCSLTSESTSTPKSSIELPLDQLTSQSSQTSVLQFFLHPPTTYNHRHVSVHLDDETPDMSYVHDMNTNDPSRGRAVHWTDEKSSLPNRRSSSQNVFQQDHRNDYYKSDSNIIVSPRQRISLNASLPYDSKLNIRIHADRNKSDNNNNESNNIKQVKAVASVQPLNDSQHEQEHLDALRKNFLEHYATVKESSMRIASINYDALTQQQELRRDKLPRHRQISLPISLPVDQRLHLYIQNGEVLARC